MRATQRFLAKSFRATAWIATGFMGCKGPAAALQEGNEHVSTCNPKPYGPSMAHLPLCHNHTGTDTTMSCVRCGERQKAMHQQRDAACLAPKACARTGHPIPCACCVSVDISRVGRYRSEGISRGRSRRDGHRLRKHRHHQHQRDGCAHLQILQS